MQSGFAGTTGGHPTVNQRTSEFNRKPVTDNKREMTGHFYPERPEEISDTRILCGIFCTLTETLVRLIRPNFTSTET